MYKLHNLNKYEFDEYYYYENITKLLGKMMNSVKNEVYDFL